MTKSQKKYHNIVPFIFNQINIFLCFFFILYFFFSSFLFTNILFLLQRTQTSTPILATTTILVLACIVTRKVASTTIGCTHSNFNTMCFVGNITDTTLNVFINFRRRLYKCLNKKSKMYYFYVLCGKKTEEKVVSIT